MRRAALFGSLALLLAGFVAGPAAQAAQRPDLLTFGAGRYEVFRSRDFKDALDLRLEHRWGWAAYASPEESFQIRPLAGVEVVPSGSLYGFGGFVLDWLIGEHWVVSPSLAAGAYLRNGGKDLGSVLEFRSTAEAGYRFDNEMRVTVYFSHISNANLASSNLGAEMAGLYLHLPFP